VLLKYTVVRGLIRDVELTNMIQPKFKRNEKPWFDKYFQYDNIGNVVG
jgi:phage I-like protein